MLSSLGVGQFVCCASEGHQGPLVEAVGKASLRGADALGEGKQLSFAAAADRQEAGCAGSPTCEKGSELSFEELVLLPAEDEVKIADVCSVAAEDVFARAALEREQRRRQREQTARSTVSPIMEGDDEGDVQEEQCVCLEVAESRLCAEEAARASALPSLLLRAGSHASSRGKDAGSPKTHGSHSTPSSSASLQVTATAAMAAVSDEDCQEEDEQRRTGALTRALSRLWRASSSLSSLLGGVSRTTHKLPTLASISQRQTLASMVSLSLGSPTLLRATRASKPLRGFGAVLRDRRSTRVGFGRSETSPDTSIDAVRKSDSFDDYLMSFQTSSIDHFWSHSWRANTTMKVSVLLLYYNQGPAVLIGILSASIGMVLRGTSLLPFWVEQVNVLGVMYRYASWSSMFGFLAFFCVLFFWRPSQRVFLDKVCIHQKDPALKKEGVESIGAFLYHSRTMLVLWDPSYVKRLWCVFEMAAFAWAHRHDLKNRVEIKPVIFAPVYFGLMLTTTINSALISFFPKILTPTFALWPLTEFLVCCLGVHFLRSFHRDMAILRENLSKFKVLNSECYCCAVSHKLPETGEKIACDREVIQACIVAWFGSLADFDDFVQAELASYFFRSLGHFCLPYRWVVGSQLPVLWAYMDGMAERIVQRAPLEFAAVLVEAIAMWCFASPLVCAFVIWVTNLLQRKRGLAVGDACVSIFATILTSLPLLALGGLWYLSRFVVSPHPLAGAFIFLVVTAELAFLTFKWGRVECRSCC
eukprot:TRINITY_DN1039_c0_g1_i1.p1 TRINITY_DN1039_c0_g1~~TRINITY_DN1039_c0_g1_i1.p1  ORF type:complete len:757 (-),score=129.93 TRINITY_DN1039_c0_g1_i1:36-2306(-)